ncbi:hypothetical protein ONZ51_g8995 [Trametes cubensis]|uniref:Uncharacterized protein n=1 Tax=Trametes cubensis TaxID=1111947 RepID=A0AAD7TMJ7_9APHY|nr:hypothetical protein ONZ51_g8995 [Trametes cubensis]
MRASTLSALCAAALVLPASAAPLDLSTDIPVPVVGATLTVKLKGPTEIPSAALPDVTPPALPTPGGKSQANRLSQSKLLKLPRAADFRQADYGVSPNVTFAMIPVQGVEATPSDTALASAATNPLRRRSEGDWEGARLKPDDYSAAASAPGDLSSDAANADDVPADAPSPDLSVLSHGAGEGFKDAGETRYRSSYAAHDLLGDTTGKLQPSTDVSKAPLQLSKLSHGSGTGGLLLRRVLEPARYFAPPLRRAFNGLSSLFANPMKGKGLMGKNNAKGLGAHTLELDTEPALPSQPDPTLNMSDPYVAQEEARRQHAGLVNIDSNRPGTPPPPAPLAGDVPFNGTATNGTATATGALENGAKDAKDGEKSAQSVKLDKAAKNATEAA